MTWFFENYKTKNANSKVFADRLGPHWVHPTQAGTANASAVVLKVVESDFRSKIEIRENRQNYAFEISAHIWRLGSKIIVSKVLKHAEINSGQFRERVWTIQSCLGPLKKNRPNQPKIEPQNDQNRGCGWGVTSHESKFWLHGLKGT